MLLVPDVDLSGGLEGHLSIGWGNVLPMVAMALGWGDVGP